MGTAGARRLARRSERWLANPHRRLRWRGALRRPWWRWRFGGFGRASVLVAPIWLLAPHKISVGEGCIVFPGAWLAVEGLAQHAGGHPLRVGNRVMIRQGATISCAERIVIEDDVTLAGRVLVTDSDHTWAAGNPGVTANPLLTSPVRIGRGTWVGEGACILRGADIGSFCIVGANSVVRGTVPDFSIVAGVPARVVGSTRDRVPASAAATEARA